MEIKVIDDSGAEVVEQTQVNNNPEGTIVPDGALLIDQIGQMFNLRPNEITQYKAKINTLLEYAKLKTDDHSAQGLKWAIRNLGTKLGTPPLGEPLVPYLSRYAHLYLESNKINNEMEEYIK